MFFKSWVRVPPSGQRLTGLFTSSMKHISFSTRARMQWFQLQMKMVRFWLIIWWIFSSFVVLISRQYYTFSFSLLFFLSFLPYLTHTQLQVPCKNAASGVDWNNCGRALPCNLPSCRRSPFSVCVVTGHRLLFISMEVCEVRRNWNDGHWAARISSSISPPPNCLATVFQGRSFEIKSLVDWRHRFGEIELVPFDKTGRNGLYLLLPLCPSLLSLHLSLLILPQSLFHLLAHSPPIPTHPTHLLLPGWLCYLSTAWCIQFPRLFSVISVNWILSITYWCFHICIKVRVVKSVKLQFRQCHSNKYTGLFLQPPLFFGSLEVAIYRFPMNLNRSVSDVYDVSTLIHV